MHVFVSIYNYLHKECVLFTKKCINHFKMKRLFAVFHQNPFLWIIVPNKSEHKIHFMFKHKKNSQWGHHRRTMSYFINRLWVLSAETFGVWFFFQARIVLKMPNGLYLPTKQPWGCQSDRFLFLPFIPTP